MGEIIVTFKSSGKILVKIDRLKIAGKDGGNAAGKELTHIVVSRYLEQSGETENSSG